LVPDARELRRIRERLEETDPWHLGGYKCYVHSKRVTFLRRALSFRVRYNEGKLLDVVQRKERWCDESPNNSLI
jgi:hypothetical protein